MDERIPELIFAILIVFTSFLVLFAFTCFLMSSLVPLNSTDDIFESFTNSLLFITFLVFILVTFMIKVGFIEVKNKNKAKFLTDSLIIGAVIALLIAFLKPDLMMVIAKGLLRR